MKYIVVLVLLALLAVGAHSITVSTDCASNGYRGRQTASCKQCCADLNMAVALVRGYMFCICSAEVQEGDTKVYEGSQIDNLADLDAVVAYRH
jgi:hypothetical protein